MSWQLRLRQLWQAAKEPRARVSRNNRKGETKRSSTSAPRTEEGQRAAASAPPRPHVAPKSSGGQGHAHAKEEVEPLPARSDVPAPSVWPECIATLGRRGSRLAPYQDWYRTQFDGIRADSPRIQMVVGLDFGTSFTKVVVGEQRAQYAVPMLDRGDPGNAYLLPGVLNVAHGLGEYELNDLKIRLLNKDYGTETQALVTAYQALVLRQARGWLMQQHRSVYKGVRLEWFVNVGLPTESALDQELSDVYRDMTRAAWALSGHAGPITLSLAEEALTTPFPDEAPEDGMVHGWAWIDRDAIRAFPEFAAQIAAYVRSPRKSDDLHAMIDIGAGTLDVTLFNVVDEDDEYSYPIFAKAVKPLGTSYLLQARLNSADRTVSHHYKSQDPVPTPEKLCEGLGLEADKVGQADIEFRRKVQGLVSNEFSYVKTQRYPSSPTWRTGVPVFVTGGGARSEFYRDALRPVFEETHAWRALQEQLPQPDSLKVEPATHERGLERLAVAYGLSMDADSLGELVRPEAIQDDRLSPDQEWRNTYVGKDDV